MIDEQPPADDERMDTSHYSGEANVDTPHMSTTAPMLEEKMQPATAITALTVQPSSPSQHPISSHHVSSHQTDDAYSKGPQSKRSSLRKSLKSSPSSPTARQLPSANHPSSPRQLPQLGSEIVTTTTRSNRTSLNLLSSPKQSMPMIAPDASDLDSDTDDWSNVNSSLFGVSATKAALQSQQRRRTAKSLNPTAAEETKLDPHDIQGQLSALLVDAVTHDNTTSFRARQQTGASTTSQRASLAHRRTIEMPLKVVEDEGCMSISQSLRQKHIQAMLAGTSKSPSHSNSNRASRSKSRRVSSKRGNLFGPEVEAALADHSEKIIQPQQPTAQRRSSPTTATATATEDSEKPISALSDDAYDTRSQRKMIELAKLLGNQE